MMREADFSACRNWRFSLRRSWLVGSGKLTAVMLNPSKADEHRDDPTTTFMLRLAQRLGMNRYEAVNLFSLVGTDPRCLKLSDNPIGLGNDAAIRGAVADADRVLVAWGNGGQHLGRGAQVLEILNGHRLECFGMTKSGAPRFPRALPSDIELRPYTPLRGEAG